MVKRLSSTDQNDSPLVNVPTPVSSGDAVNKSYADTKASASSVSNVDNTSNATERAATATLTNKDLSSSTNTFPDYYPVGTQYVNLTNSANPSTYLPGQSSSTWVADSGTVTVAKAASGTFSTAGATGGAETHTLTQAEQANMRVATGPSGTNDWLSIRGGGSVGAYTVATTTSGTAQFAESNAIGGGGAHNNLQPSAIMLKIIKT